LTFDLSITDCINMIDQDHNWKHSSGLFTGVKQTGYGVTVRHNSFRLKLYPAERI